MTKLSHLNQKLTVIIPITAEEAHWPRLVGQLRLLGYKGPIHLVMTLKGFERQRHLLASHHDTNCSWVISHTGRAAQLNSGAVFSRTAYLWFLHADSQLNPQVLHCLDQALATDSQSLMYFGLRFYDGPLGLQLNARGAVWRSKTWGIPFGDQGFCLAKRHWQQAGGFDSTQPYGEDHCFVWQCRRQGIRTQLLPAALATSGRKYAHHGWLRTTFKHWFLTAKQAWEQAQLSHHTTEEPS